MDESGPGSSQREKQVATRKNRARTSVKKAEGFESDTEVRRVFALFTAYRLARAAELRKGASLGWDDSLNLFIRAKALLDKPRQGALLILISKWNRAQGINVRTNRPSGEFLPRDFVESGNN